MSYTPIRPEVYLKAFAGCTAGLCGRSGRTAEPFDYALVITGADAFAQEVDAVWGVLGAGVPTQFSLNALSEISEAVWEARSPLEASFAPFPSSYEGMAQGIVAAVIEAELQVEAHGIDPDAGGGNTELSQAIVTPATPVHEVLRTFAAGEVLLDVNVYVTTAFDGLARLRLQTAAGTVLGPSEATLQAEGQYGTSIIVVATGADALELFFTVGGATVGQALVTFTIGRPSPAPAV